MMPVVTRFAPSPTGFLHLGHAFSALLNFDAARRTGGRFLLRIEDIDRDRCRPEFEQAIFEDLWWLGIAWEVPVRRQSERLSHYAEKLASLAARGLVYRCFRSRKDIAEAMSAPHAATPAFTGAALTANDERKNLAEDKPYAWRLSVAACRRELGAAFDELAFQEQTDLGLIERPADAARLGDVVLGRKDAGTSYHMASVIDDAEQGVSHVIRGEDLREAAGLHRLLQALMGLPTPLYAHHRLITDASGNRLSKRNKSETLQALRAAGVTAADIRERLFA
jgi:glutamyl-Q tRNA(Asp) synthetase